eukprot:3741192-Amphidinium_carterae.3
MITASSLRIPPLFVHHLETAPSSDSNQESCPSSLFRGRGHCMMCAVTPPACLPIEPTSHVHGPIP